jgi:hypothetical protein
MGLAIASDWMSAPELADGHGAARPRRLELPRVDLWAVFATDRLASAKARAFADFAGPIVAAQSILDHLLTARASIKAVMCAPDVSSNTRIESRTHVSGRCGLFRRRLSGPALVDSVVAGLGGERYDKTIGARIASSGSIEMFLRPGLYLAD